MRYLIDDEIDTVLRESNVALFGTDDYDSLMEKWSPAARAASAAARRAKGKGQNWRKAARGAYVGSSAGRRAAVASVKKQVGKRDEAVANARVGRPKPGVSLSTTSGDLGRTAKGNPFAKERLHKSRAAKQAARFTGASAPRSKQAKRVASRIGRVID